jgi:hypothetical protein
VRLSDIVAVSVIGPLHHGRRGGPASHGATAGLTSAERRRPQPQAKGAEARARVVERGRARGRNKFASPIGACFGVSVGEKAVVSVVFRLVPKAFRSCFGRFDGPCFGRV